MIDRKEILKIEDLTVRIKNGKRRITILENITLTVREGERWAIAGESGAGKSMTMNAITALLPEGSTEMEGKILFRLPDESWLNLLELPYKKRHAFVSEHVAVIFQDSINALNPNERIVRQWSDTVRLHDASISQEELEKHLLKRMDIFGVRGGKETLNHFPDQLSGGMRQRIAIAMALESRAGILIADEPTTSLDAISQRNTIEFIRMLLDTNELTLLFISHNLGVLQYICDHILIMKDGHMVEQGLTDDVFYHPKESYTQELIRETMNIMGKDAPEQAETL